VIFTYFLNFDNESLIFNQIVEIQQSTFSLLNLNCFFLLVNFADYNFVTFSTSLPASSVIDFIKQTDDIFFFNNLENIKTIYHYSIPNTKLAYPEPFIASASMMHSDL
jgi:hypothetical protein